MTPLSEMPWTAQILLGATNTPAHMCQKFVTGTQLDHAVAEYKGLGCDDSLLPRICGHLSIGLEYINNVKVLAGALATDVAMQYVRLFPLEILERNASTFSSFTPKDIDVDLGAIIAVVDTGENLPVYLKSLTLAQLIHLRTLGTVFNASPKAYYEVLCELYLRIGVDITKLPSSDMLLSIPPDIMAFIRGKIAEETEDNFDLIMTTVDDIPIDFMESKCTSFEQALNTAFDDCAGEGTLLSMTTVIRLYKGMVDVRAKPNEVKVTIAALGYRVDEDRNVRKRENMKVVAFKPTVYDLPAEYSKMLEANSIFVNACPTNVPDTEIATNLAQLHESDWVDYLNAIYRFGFSYVLGELIDRLLVANQWITAFNVYYCCFSNYYAAVADSTLPGWSNYFKVKTSTYLKGLNVTNLDDANKSFILQNTKK